MKEEYRQYSYSGIEINEVYNQAPMTINITVFVPSTFYVAIANKYGASLTGIQETIQEGATITENLMPVVIDSVKNFSTLGNPGYAGSVLGIQII